MSETVIRTPGPGARQPGPIELIVFDWDGTLADSEARIVRSMAAAFESVGIRPPDVRRLRSVIGLGLNEAMAELLPAGVVDAIDPQRLAAGYRQHFGGPEREPVALFDGARETLDALRVAGFRLAVATGKGRAGLDRDICEANLEGYFEITRCADETRSKPHPQMMLEILEWTVVEPEQALMVGDTDYDLQMASAARVSSVGVTCGVHDEQRLQAAEPLALIDDVVALPDWLLQRPS